MPSSSSGRHRPFASMHPTVYPGLGRSVLENRCQKEGADERVLVKTAGLALGSRDVDKNEGWIVGWCQVRRDLGDDDVHELRVVRVRLYYQCRALLPPRPARVREPCHHDIATGRS